MKDVQGVLRHSRTATTTDIYMQEIPEGVRGTIDSIHRELMKSPSLAAGSKTKKEGSPAPSKKRWGSGGTRMSGRRELGEEERKRLYETPSQQGFENLATKCYQARKKAEPLSC